MYADYAEGLSDNFAALRRVHGMRARRTSIAAASSNSTAPNSASTSRSSADRTSGVSSRKSRLADAAARLESAQASAEMESRRVLLRAAARSTNAGIRKLLDDLGEERNSMRDRRRRWRKKLLTAPPQQRGRITAGAYPSDHPARPGRLDGRLGLDARAGVRGAFATHRPGTHFWSALRHRSAQASSMGFAEALSDDGRLTGRGAPLVRGLVCGLMTLCGGIGHTLPFLIPRLLYCDRRRDRGRCDRIDRDRLDPVALHGRPAGLRRRQGDDRRRAGAGGRHPDRRELKRTRGARSTPWLPTRSLVP